MIPAANYLVDGPSRGSYVRNMPVMLTDPSGLCLPVVQNHDTNGPKDAKSAGPASGVSAYSGVDSDSWNADPQGNGAPQEGCSQGYGNTGNWAPGGYSIAGGKTFSPGDGAGGLLGNSESTIPCSNSGCNLDQDGNFVGSKYNPSGYFSSACSGPWANPTANCSNPLWHPQGWQYGIVGRQFDSAYDPPIGLDIFHCPDGCGHIFTAANTTVNVATAREVALVGGAFSAPAVVTVSATVFGWDYGAYMASATGVVALGSQADTELAALEEGVSKLSVSPGTYNFLNNMGQWWTVNRAFLDANVCFGDRFTYVTDPSVVWSGSWYLTELQYLKVGQVP